MKICILDLKSFGIDSIAKAFKKAGHNVSIFPIRLDDVRICPDFDSYFAHSINNSYDIVFTYNFYPVISNCCKKYNVKYVCWVYDNPLVVLYSYTVINPCNYIFIFDKEMYLELHNAGIPTVYYLPLAADIKNIFPKEQYKCDASFVGSLYNEPKQRLYDKYFTNISEYTRGYLEGIINSQLKVYGYFFIENLLNKDILNDLQNSVKITPNPDGVETPSYIYAHYFIARKITELERREMINRVSEICNFKLYTHTNNPVDYYNDMPYVFSSSKINLNISLKSIRSGIPLRAFDIMSAGGFLLTNYQADFLDYFTPEEDFVYYDSIDDAVNKVKYYLKNDSRRREIAANGFSKIKEFHSFDCRVKEILNIVLN